MKKLLLIGLMLFTTSAMAVERMDQWGNLISNRCNGWNGEWFVYYNQWALVGSSCRLPSGILGTVGG